MFGLPKPSHWQHVSPTGAIGDFREAYRLAGPGRWKLVLASIVVAAGIFWLLTHQSWRRVPDRPKINYINSWPKDRTAAETAAFIKENQKIKDELRAAEERAAEEAKAAYRALGRASGMDVDRIDRDARAARAAEEARKAQASKAPVAPR